MALPRGPARDAGRRAAGRPRGRPLGLVPRRSRTTTTSVAPTRTSRRCSTRSPLRATPWSASAWPSICGIDADWQFIKPDPRLLPMSFVSRRSKLPSDDAAIAAQARARIMGTPELRRRRRRVRPRIGDPRDRARPVALVRTPAPRHALGGADHDRAPAERACSPAGKARGRCGWAPPTASAFPSLAVQHGVIYPNNPDYYRPLHPGLVRPDVTCVYGPYERDLLIKGGHYDPATVVVTGSPRVHPDDAAVDASPDGGHRPAPRARRRGWRSAARRVGRSQPDRRRDAQREHGRAAARRAVARGPRRVQAPPGGGRAASTTCGCWPAWPRAGGYPPVRASASSATSTCTGCCGRPTRTSASTRRCSPTPS